MPLSIIKDVLEKNGASVSIDDSKISISYAGKDLTLDVDDDWKKEIRSFERSNQYEFELESRKLIGPKSLELGISRLSQDFLLHLVTSLLLKTVEM
ncbi:MAG: hypothetical protein ABIJ24_01900 [Nitrospinota bacterium]|nr:hypothetical protein [Nitrospinota bacterium]